jgi:heme-degrading monooxygenase HmoA
VIAVLFEVWPNEECEGTYLDIAAMLRDELEASEGFVSIERFRSVNDPKKLLSLSFWEDEAAVARWRAVEAHRDAQRRGRAELFRDYRLRIAHVTCDYGARDREQAPEDSRVAHG